jgi:hypothetical protein
MARGRKGARYAGYLFNGMNYGAPAATIDCESSHITPNPRKECSWPSKPAILAAITNFKAHRIVLVSMGYTNPQPKMSVRIPTLVNSVKKVEARTVYEPMYMKTPKPPVPS